MIIPIYLKLLFKKRHINIEKADLVVCLNPSIMGTEILSPLPHWLYPDFSYW